VQSFTLVESGDTRIVEVWGHGFHYPYFRTCLSGAASGNDYYADITILSKPRFMKDVPVSPLD